MKKLNRQERKSLLILSVIFGVLLIVVLLFQFGVLQTSYIGTTKLTYKTTFKIEAGKVGTGITEAMYEVPLQTTEFSITPNYNTYSREGAGRFYVKYEIFNYQTSNWETFEENTWDLLDNGDYDSRINTKASNTYENGKPYKLFTRDNDVYYSCIDSMYVKEAEQLGYMNPSKINHCIYPGENIPNVNVNSNRYIYYFPQLSTFNGNYINENREVQLKITYNPQKGMKNMYNDDFTIDVWRIITPQPTVWTYNPESNKCEKNQKYTYELTIADYYTESECILAHNLETETNPEQEPILPNPHNIVDILILVGVGLVVGVLAIFIIKKIKKGKRK